MTRLKSPTALGIAHWRHRASTRVEHDGGPTITHSTRGQHMRQTIDGYDARLIGEGGFKRVHNGWARDFGSFQNPTVRGQRLALFDHA